MAKEDIDNRILKWVSYIIDNKIYKSEASYLRILGLPPNKLSDVRNGKTRFTATDIDKIMVFTDYMKNLPRPAARNDQKAGRNNCINTSGCISLDKWTK